MPSKNINKATAVRLKTQVVIRISDDLKDALAEKAEKQGLTPASVARQTLERSLLGKVESAGVTRGRKPDADSKAAKDRVAAEAKRKAKAKAKAKSKTAA